MEQRLFDLLARDGVWLLFAAQLFGIFGLPIPDELLLTFAGGLVRRGDLAGPPTFAAAVAGGMAGMTFNYMVGRFGVRVLRRLRAVDTLNRAQSWFKRWGNWLLVFGCFVPGLRHITSLEAGSGKLDFRHSVRTPIQARRCGPPRSSRSDTTPARGTTGNTRRFSYSVTTCWSRLHLAVSHRFTCYAEAGCGSRKGDAWAEGKRSITPPVEKES